MMKFLFFLINKLEMPWAQKTLVLSEFRQNKVCFLRRYGKDLKQEK